MPPRERRPQWRADPDTPRRPAQPAQPEPALPPGQTTIICVRCGGHYIDDNDGRGAHRVVFGHHPASRTDGGAD